MQSLTQSWHFSILITTSSLLFVKPTKLFANIAIDGRTEHVLRGGDIL